MHRNWTKRTLWTVAAIVAVIGLAWFARPQPIPVDLATVREGSMEVTVDDDGKTEVRHVYTVSAPLAGKVLRISRPHGEEAFSRHVGDSVVANDTVVAVMQPMVPSFIDFRSREETEAAVAAADAAVKYAESEVRRLQAAVTFYRAEFERADALVRTRTISAEAHDKAKFDVENNEASLASARTQVEVWQSVRASLAARLINPSSATSPTDPACCVQLRSPVSGRVLKVIQESEAVVQAGTPLIEIGDPLDLDIVADLLSSDAVQIKPGAPVRIDGWGGVPIRGRVTRVDPAGFLKVSALGIEEQRVHVTIDFADPPSAWSKLGHDYRVTVHVSIWNADRALTVPVGALFRSGERWAVFVVRDDRAHAMPIEIGHRNNSVAEVVSGLAAGDKVILHPSDRIKEGISVSERSAL